MYATFVLTVLFISIDFSIQQSKKLDFGTVTNGTDSSSPENNNTRQFTVEEEKITGEEKIKEMNVFENLMERVKVSRLYIDYLDLSNFYDFETLNISSSLIDKYLPKGWSEFCTVKVGRYITETKAAMSSLVYLDCYMNESHKLNFISFRNLTANINISTLDFALNIKCSSGIRISVPWPMRAYLLKYISIDNCVITDFKSEYYDESIESIPDTLLYLRIANTNLSISYDKFLAEAKNYPEPRQQTRASDCGPVNLYMYIKKNINHEFDYTNLSPSREHYPILAQYMNKIYRHLSVIKYTCDFNNLWLYDRSYCKSMGMQSDKFTMQNSKFPKLEILNISHTEMNEIPDQLRNWRLQLPALNYLDMSYNNISEFHMLKDYSLEIKNPSVGKIDLRYNNVTTITAKGIKHLARAKYFVVDLRNNPFVCGCDMRYFVDFMTSNKNLTAIKFSNYDYFNTFTCAKPTGLKGRKIVQLNNIELGCEVNTYTVLQGPIIILSSLVTILLAVIVLSIRYRKEITILAFTRLNIIIPCQHTTTDENKKYDAFVAYSQHDIEWVLKTLAPRLENQNLFKLCLHHRDFEIGAAISDNIIKSVELSRHTVLVISKNFLKSEWCLLEFRTALQQSLIEKKRHLIMVLLEDIPTQEIDNDIKRCLQTLTYVKGDDRWFWDKLIYALSDKSRKRKQRRNMDIRLNKIVKPNAIVVDGIDQRDIAVRY